MKANAPKRKVFQDAVDLISPPEDMPKADTRLFFAVPKEAYRKDW